MPVDAHELFEAHRHIADYFANRYRPFNILLDRDDIRQIALLTIWEKALTFDESICGSDFGAYVKRSIRYALVDELRDIGAFGRGDYKKGMRASFEEVRPWHATTPATQLERMLAIERVEALAKIDSTRTKAIWKRKFGL